MKIKSYKRRSIRRDEPVEIYRNLHRRGVVYSVRQRGRVVAHATELVLSDVAFVVNTAGHRRAKIEKTRNVHAWARGWITDVVPRSIASWPRIRYDLPTGAFYQAGEGASDDREVTRAALVRFANSVRAVPFGEMQRRRVSSDRKHRAYMIASGWVD